VIYASQTVALRRLRCEKPAVAVVAIFWPCSYLSEFSVGFCLLQALETFAPDAAALRGQLAEAKQQAQEATAKAATLQQLLDSERAAAAEEVQQLEAAFQRNMLRRATFCLVEDAEIAQQQAESDAGEARAELESHRTQVHMAGHFPRVSKLGVKHQASSVAMIIASECRPQDVSIAVALALPVSLWYAEHVVQLQVCSLAASVRHSSHCCVCRPCLRSLAERAALTRAALQPCSFALGLPAKPPAPGSA
jgi:hypothetical protein